ncbi:troponin T, skeletal muscle-like [Pistacia vera]|uniref:troponin T, skeletal muscle-like n=1 Tax=Pistacia vera TaxID=55513 RepID=UPI001262FCFE|nr:troponin T, skeletal muscle-like [Pistacia vera]
MEAEHKSVMEKERGDELIQSVDQTPEANADHQAVKGESEEVEQEVAEETKYVIEEEDHEEESNKEAEAETQADFNFRQEAEEEEEEEEREQNGMISTEELNKKFEDFIRKMKEELRIEARQQLVMV